MRFFSTKAGNYKSQARIGSHFMEAWPRNINVAAYTHVRRDFDAGPSTSQKGMRSGSWK